MSMITTIYKDKEKTNALYPITKTRAIFDDNNVNLEQRLNEAMRHTVIETWTEDTNWYRIWSDGWIEQGGMTTINPNTSTTITFNTPFAKSNAVFIPNLISSSFNPNNWSIQIWSYNYITTTNTSVCYVGDAERDICWYACGY